MSELSMQRMRWAGGRWGVAIKPSICSRSLHGCNSLQFYGIVQRCCDTSLFCASAVLYNLTSRSSLVMGIEECRLITSLEERVSKQAHILTLFISQSFLHYFRTCYSCAHKGIQRKRSFYLLIVVGFFVYSVVGVVPFLSPLETS